MVIKHEVLELFEKQLFNLSNQFVGFEQLRSPMLEQFLVEFDQF